MTGQRGAKLKLGVTVDPDLHRWALQYVGKGREFSSFSHAVERGLVCLRREMEELEELRKKRQGSE